MPEALLEKVLGEGRARLLKDALDIARGDRELGGQRIDAEGGVAGARRDGGEHLAKARRLDAAAHPVPAHL